MCLVDILVYHGSVREVNPDLCTRRRVNRDDSWRYDV